MKRVYLLPNLLTTGNLALGLLAIMNLAAGAPDAVEKVPWMILIAIVLDGLDGRVAALTNTQSLFGLNYDSLADLVTFGVAPAVLVLRMMPAAHSKLTVAVGVVFALGAALRLARFNVQTLEVDSGGFVGLPSPAAGGTVATICMTLLKSNVSVEHVLLQLGMLTLLPILAFLMISNFAYPSLKKIRWEGHIPFHYLGMVVLAILLLTLWTDPVLLAFFTLYAFSGPALALRHLKRAGLIEEEERERS